MSFASEQLIILAILLPLLASVLIILADKQPNLREAITLVTASIVAFIVITLAMRVQAGEVPILELFEVVPGITVSFNIEPLGMLFALVAGTLWLITSIYAIGYMRGHHEKNQTRFYAAFAVAISAALAAAFCSLTTSSFTFSMRFVSRILSQPPASVRSRNFCSEPPGA